MPKSEIPQTASLRERLKQQADVARETEKKRADEESAHVAFYATQLRERMLLAAAYFEAIVEDLQTIQFETTATYPFGPAKERDVNLRQKDFRFSVDDVDQPQKVSVMCTCELKFPVSRNVASLHDANDFEAMLRETGIHYYRHRQEDMSASGSESSRFTIEGSLNAGFYLQANAGKRGIDVQTRNLENEPTRNYLLRPERVDEALFDRLGRLLLREVDSVVTTEVEPEVRKALQAEATRRQRERASFETKAQSASKNEAGAARTSRKSRQDAGKRGGWTLRDLTRWAGLPWSNQGKPRD